MQITINALDELSQAAQTFATQIDQRTVFAFYGSMGAGKTTFIKAICEALGVTDTVQSPTFAIVNDYRSETSGELIHHFDFYRIKSLGEVYDMGYEDYFYSGALCFIEWPELIEELLPEDTVAVHISEQADGSRLITWDDAQA
ncbi:MAG: tRNA (adenosine(37)-N6)-threonylcarbamoyltransferase complex ATPase subunit type 1 TsaE [Bacteroidales bacterium]|nr:tRNA (adenosine(37)-N6)-threonylcarbamoyltransferase complex ATPase subunit type 1 TsaE [Bacteroidales bacterium]